MLFNSYFFIFLFLPLVLCLVFYFSSKGNANLAATMLVISSLFFYSWWNPVYLPLIICSILFNFWLAKLIYKNILILFIGLAFNLGLIAYFKYANFFVENINLLFQDSLYIQEIILPLAISFFTFQQIAYLVDAYRGQAEKYSFLHYSLFVTFFPQLIAGPIVHHKEIMPQFLRKQFLLPSYRNCVLGLSLFALGLFKKIIFADSMSVYASATFDAAEAGVSLTIFEAWLGSLAYSMQLYFDFSGYSDMALGLATMFGLKLPVNFFSPYKATNIADFWRRWHITLSRMIRAYLWDPISLSMTRTAVKSRYGFARFFIATSLIPTLFTFFWIGLWHGAGWNFIIFGLLHGLYIAIFNLWTQLKQRYLKDNIISNRAIGNFFARFLTFLCVVFGWIFFRAETLPGAKNIISSMIGLNGISLSPRIQGFIEKFGFIEKLIDGVVVFEGMSTNGVLGNEPFKAVISIMFLIVFCFMMPNCIQIFSKYQPYILTYTSNGAKNTLFSKSLRWRPIPIWIFISSMAFVFAIINLVQESEFLYFQF